MIIGIDASRALRAKRTGTERYSLEIIRHLLALPEANEHTWFLYVDCTPEQAVERDIVQLFANPASVYATSSANSEGTRKDAAKPENGLPEILQLEALQSKNVQLRWLPRRRMWTHRSLAAEVVGNRPDVLFVPAHVLPFRLPIKRLPPSVVTIHDMGYRYYPTAHTLRQRLYLDWSTRWSATAATQLIAISQATANDLEHFYATPQEKVHVVYEATEKIKTVTPSELALLRSRYHLKRPYALYVGTIQPRKNLQRLIQAYLQLFRHEAPSWDLVLAGKAGWLSQSLYEEAQNAGFADRIHFPGYVPEADLPALLSGARFFCFPSLFEGFGLPILESQSYGVPVMTASNSSLPEIAGDAAILVDPTDVDEIAQAMLQLSQDEDLRARLIAAGRENVKRFSWEKAAKETLAVLKMAAGK